MILRDFKALTFDCYGTLIDWETGISQSLFHDHVPARRLGLATCWVDRRAGQPGWGATAIPADIPDTDFRFTSLAEMAQAHAAG